MFKTKSKSKLPSPEADPLAPSAEFLASTARWNAYQQRLAALDDKIDAIRLARSIDANPGSAENVPPHLHKKAEPFKKLAKWRPVKLAEVEADAEADRREVLKTGDHENTEIARARRRETNRLAIALQPRHRAAVKAMAAAVEALSRAIADERAARDELRRRAPLPTSPNLPDLSGDLLVGAVPDVNSPAAAWARKVRKLKILE